MKQCPICYSGNCTEYTEYGISGIRCNACGFDSGERERVRIEQKLERDRRQREREQERSR